MDGTVLGLGPERTMRRVGEKNESDGVDDDELESPLGELHSVGN